MIGVEAGLAPAPRHLEKVIGTVKVRAGYYRQFDADLTREVPAEGYGGWEQAEIELSLEHTAVVVMHAWEAGSPEQYPGWYRCVEYIPRAQRIAREVFPGLLAAVRASSLPLFHVVGGRDYYSHLAGHRRAVELAGPPPPPLLQAESDPALERLREFRRQHVFVGPHNEADVNRGFAGLDFMPEARPLGEEGVAESGDQLFALCRNESINHLIYAGFAINWCLLLSPGGMAEMQKHGVICSALRQAVTAVENRETARQESCKEIALWRVALAFGFVFEVPEFVAALGTG